MLKTGINLNVKRMLEQMYFEHTLYVKTEEGGKLLMVCLYVDDLIFTGNDAKMFDEFKKSMMTEFEND